jgi:CRP/FNR family transcriptional regulator
MTACACQADDCVLCEERLYPGLATEQLCQIRERLIRHAYEAHEVLFREGEPATCLFALGSGQVKLTTPLPDGRQQLLRLVVAGQLLGLETLGGERYPFTAEALTAVMVCKILHRDLRRILESNQGLAWRVIQSLSQELEQAEALIRDLGLKTAQEKIASFLLSLPPRRADHDKEKPPLLLSRREMAETLGLTEETVSRTMAELGRKGVIETGKGFVRIVDPRWLEAHTGVGDGARFTRHRATSH